MFNFHSTASLIFGNETAVNSSDQILNLLGKNIFVITDEGLTELGLYDKTIKKLQDEGERKNYEFKKRQKTWSGRKDSNLRPPGPKPGALPGCATPRKKLLYSYIN